MRECWVIEEQDKETGEWFAVDVTVDGEHARQMLREWLSDYTHRVVRYVPADTLAQLDAARAKDAEEIADLTRKLRVFLSFPCHWTRGEIEYTTDCGQTAFPVTSVPDGQCHGCGRPIVVSVPSVTTLADNAHP